MIVINAQPETLGLLAPTTKLLFCHHIRDQLKAKALIKQIGCFCNPIPSLIKLCYLTHPHFSPPKPSPLFR